MEPIVCGCCGTVFRPWNSQQKYCSKKCKRTMDKENYRLHHPLSVKREQEYAASIDTLVAAAKATWSSSAENPQDDDTMIYGNMITI